jgi:hypothetical protein
MKSLEQILLDNPPFYPDSSTDAQKMRFMFLMEDGHLIGDSEGHNHRTLLGWTPSDPDPGQVEETFCKQNKCLRLCFQPFWELDGRRGNFWCLYIQPFEIQPNDAQWSTLGVLFNLNGRSDTLVTWDVRAPQTERGWIHGEGSLNDFKRLICPLPLTTAVKRRKAKRARPKRKNAQGGSKR